MGDPGIISVSQEVDLETAMKYSPNDIIMGNIPPPVIQAGTAEQVYEQTRIYYDALKSCYFSKIFHAAAFSN